MPSRVQKASLIAVLKQVLKARGLTYAQLAQAIDLSEASVKRLFSEETFTLKRLEQILDVLEMDLFELARLARGAATSVKEMSIKQEAAIAEDARLMGVFYLVFNDWQAEDIVARYEISKAECIGLLARLDRLRLIDLLPGDRVRLRVPRTLRLRQGGPIQERHGKAALDDFLQVNFAKAGGFFWFDSRELSSASTALFRRRLEHLAAELGEMAELDSYLPSDQRRTIGIALAIRPWMITMVTGLKLRSAASGARPDRFAP